MGESEAGDGTGHDSVTTESTRIEAVEGDGAGCVLAEVTETKACDRAGLVDQAAESEGTDRRTDSIHLKQFTGNLMLLMSYINNYYYNHLCCAEPRHAEKSVTVSNLHVCTNLHENKLHFYRS